LDTKQIKIYNIDFKVIGEKTKRFLKSFKSELNISKFFHVNNNPSLPINKINTYNTWYIEWNWLSFRKY
jgi:hypothetical protein